MMPYQMAVEIASNMIREGKVRDAASANVEVVRIVGVMLITSPVPREVRSAFSAAVKEGRLGRLPKKGLLPEAFFHPNSKANAMEERESHARASIAALRKVYAPMSEVITA